MADQYLEHNGDYLTCDKCDFLISFMFQEMNLRVRNSLSADNVRLYFLIVRNVILKEVI